MLIRPETASDYVVIHELTARAFAGLPYSDGSEPRIVDALRAAAALTISLVADEGGKVIGHVAVSPVSIQDNTPGWYGVGPVSVEPNLQRKGLGSRLMRVTLDSLARLDAAGCVVLGDPAYYLRFGFTQHHGLRYQGPPPEYFMALAFKSALPVGEVKYHPAFHGDA